jgi:phage shock protein A
MMAESIFLRASNAFMSRIEIGVESAERTSRLGLSRQSVREVQAVIDDLRDRRFAAERDRDQATRDAANQTALAIDWGEKAAYALSKAREDLAEQAIGRQLDAERAVALASNRVRSFDAEIERLTEQASALAGERTAMNEALAAAGRQRSESGLARSGTTPEQRVELAKARFDQLMDEERSARPTVSVASEIDDLRRADDVAQRLKALQTAPMVTVKRRTVKRG